MKNWVIILAGLLASDGMSMCTDGKVGVEVVFEGDYEKYKKTPLKEGHFVKVWEGKKKAIELRQGYVTVDDHATVLLEGVTNDRGDVLLWLLYDDEGPMQGQYINESGKMFDLGFEECFADKLFKIPS